MIGGVLLSKRKIFKTLLLILSVLLTAVQEQEHKPEPPWSENE